VSASINPRILNQINQTTPQFRYTPLGGVAFASNLDYRNKKIFSGVAEAYASYTFNIGSNRLNAPIHPITWLHVKTKQPVITLDMLSDSGADYSTIDSKYAAALGISLTQGIKVSVAGTGGQVENPYYIHQIPFKIGNLPPAIALVAVGTGGGTQVFGRTSGLNLYSVTYTQKTVKYTELNQAQAAYARAGANWRNRI
jgi:hypothetical protein